MSYSTGKERESGCRRVDCTGQGKRPRPPCQEGSQHVEKRHHMINVDGGAMMAPDSEFGKGFTVLNTKILELKSYTNEIKYRSYQTVIPIQESWNDGNICNIPFDITTALMTDKPYIFYVLPCSVIGHQVRYDYDLSTSTVAIVSIEFGAQLIAGNNVRFGIFIAGI